MRKKKIGSLRPEEGGEKNCQQRFGRSLLGESKKQPTYLFTCYLSHSTGKRTIGGWKGKKCKPKGRKESSRLPLALSPSKGKEAFAPLGVKVRNCPCGKEGREKRRRVERS